MKRVFNFCAGPSTLPVPVLERVSAEMLNLNGLGYSMMEMNHRTKEFDAIIEKSEALLRELMNIPTNYKILFLQGGASLQFAMVPLNLAARDKKAVYIDTGIWAEKAIQEAEIITDVDVRASSKDRAYSYIPPAPAIKSGDAYYHIVQNNTAVGTRWAEIPYTGEVPLVSDISSCILSEPIDVSKYGLLYAGSQKNMGPAGVTIVIIRDDLLGYAKPDTPIILRYDAHAEGLSIYNTPACFGIYVIGLALEWLKSLGGVPEIAKINREKAKLLYECLENSKMFRLSVEKPFRSLMNVTFGIKEDDPEKRNAMENRFVQEANTAGLINLAGYKLLGGFRASIYNAMPIEGVQALVKFIRQFERS
jgi:phosphoserine aminotransferase